MRGNCIARCTKPVGEYVLSDFLLGAHKGLDARIEEKFEDRRFLSIAAAINTKEGATSKNPKLRTLLLFFVSMGSEAING